jgi:serine/threonine-protein kinase
VTSPGARIGPYEIVSPLGRGGMGEVYRARDARLQRDVAVKLLPASVAADPDRLARFTREAQLLATLNHPNIGAIYGVEESAAGAALVLELVEGPTLADRIAQGPLALDDATAIARQIADAVESAHEQGIIHRDLKPANIKLRPDGTVKVLDFGLAKTMAASAASGSAALDAAASPTLTAHATADGLILGTAAYMAPEQARGRAVDRRADIWALGVVLFEMLAAERPFGGETVSEMLAAIIKDPPSWSALPSTIPAPLRALLTRMLEKDPRRRLRDIGDARLALEELAAGGGEAIAGGPAASPARTSSWGRLVPWGIALLAVAAAAVFASQAARTPASEPPLLKFTLPMTDEAFERTALPAISPDGRHVVFAKGGQLWVRSLHELEPRQLAGTTGAQFPFWSPDSRQIAYLTTTALWRVGIDGSQPVQITTYRFSKGGRTPGGVWRTDDTIVFAPAATGSGLMSASIQGGEFTEFYARDPKVEGDFHRPSLLPDGRSLVFAVDHIDRGTDTIGLLVDGRRKDILTLKGESLESPAYSPTGHILYHRETTTPGIWALPFSIDRLEPTGAPFLVAAQGSYPSVASNGTLIYADDSISGMATLAWTDVQTGVMEPAMREQFPGITHPRLSPNGRYVTAVVQWPGLGQVVIVSDLQRGTHVRLGDRADSSSRPAWWDDQRVLFARNDGVSQEIVMRAANGSGGETVVTPGVQPSIAAGRLVFPKIVPGSGGDLYHLLLPSGDAPGKPELLQHLPVHEWEPALSPDGALLAYSSGDAGQSEVILRTYPDASGQWQVSSSGGSLPVWSRTGDAIYYKDPPGQIFRVAVRSKPSMTLGAPQLVPRPASLVARVGFDVAPDGRRLLMVREVRTDEQRRTALAVVQNWSAAFRKP